MIEMWMHVADNFVPVSSTLADTGVAFVPMLVAAGIVLVITGIVVVFARLRLTRAGR